MIPKPKRRKHKQEKVQKIKLQNKKECWVCGTTQNLERHHCIYGHGRRKISERYGLVIYLCHNHHNENVPGDRGLHFNKGLDDRVKQYAQSKFEKVYGHEKWMLEFGRNYL